MLTAMTETILCSSVARRFFVDGLSKSEIAVELGISRFRVARLIEKALSDGIVRIEFSYPADEIDYPASAALQVNSGLTKAIVVSDTNDDLDLLLDRMGKVAGRVLADISSPRQVLGVASTRVSEAMTRNLQAFPNGAVVQLAGAWPGAGSGQTSVEMVHTIARISSSPSFSFYAPLLASDAEAAQAFRRQADVERAVALFDKVTTAIVGLGALGEGLTTLWPSLSADERRETLAAGAVGEICGQTFTIEGAFVETPMSRRAIGMPLEALRACPEVMCLAFDNRKSEAIVGAIRGGLIKTLVTHSSCAAMIADRLKQRG